MDSLLSTTRVAGLVTGLALFSATSAHALTEFDQNVTGDVIFGSGNANGGFTTHRQNGVELGLRAKLRFDASNNPANIFNSNGDGTYTFDAGLPPTGFAFAPGSTSTAKWNFEWSINSNYDGSVSGRNLDDLTYIFSIDFDPTPGTNVLAADPINLTAPLFADYAIGTNATSNGAGISAANRTQYESLIANNNLAQASVNMEFIDNMYFPFNGNAQGTYTFTLTAFDGARIPANQLASTSIDVNVVPTPTAALGGVVLLGGLVTRRRRRAIA